MTCDLTIKLQIALDRPDGSLNCGNCLVDNPVGVLGPCRNDANATYTVDCEWGSDTGIMIFIVDNTSDLEFGEWACGDALGNRVDFERLYIRRFG